MHRTQIMLEKDQYLALQKLARRRGISMGRLVREFVELGLRKKDPDQHIKEESLESLQGFIDRADTTGRDHDKVLYGRDD